MHFPRDELASPVRAAPNREAPLIPFLSDLYFNLQTPRLKKKVKQYPTVLTFLKNLSKKTKRDEKKIIKQLEYRSQKKLVLGATGGMRAT